VAKFFWWEAGYFSTLDIILDRAGYYICWGCLVWVPCLYTFSSYYMVAHPPVVSTTTALLIALLGLLTILLNYHVDYEKQMFRRAPDGKCELWGKPARFIVAQYKDSSGNVQASKLLLSGKCNLWTNQHSTERIMFLSAYWTFSLGYPLESTNENVLHLPSQKTVLCIKM
jgi:Ergosterol biosynthesis ERG4/ERG24 family.